MVEVHTDLDSNVHAQLPGPVQRSPNGMGHVGQSGQRLVMLRSPTLWRHDAEGNRWMPTQPELSKAKGTLQLIMNELHKIQMLILIL